MTSEEALKLLVRFAVRMSILGVERNLERAVFPDLGIGHRAVSVGDAVHAGDLDDVSYCEDGLVGSDLLELPQVRVDPLGEVLHEDLRPVVLGVEVADRIVEAGVGIGHVAGHRAAQEALGELGGVHVQGDDSVGEAYQGGTGAVAVPLELLVGRAETVGVVFFEPAGAAGGEKENQAVLENVLHLLGPP